MIGISLTCTFCGSILFTDPDGFCIECGSKQFGVLPNYDNEKAEKAEPEQDLEAITVAAVKLLADACVTMKAAGVMGIYYETTMDRLLRWLPDLDNETRIYVLQRLVAS